MPEVQLSSRSRRQTSRDGRSSRQFGSVPFGLTFHLTAKSPKVNRHYVISYALSEVVSLAFCIVHRSSSQYPSWPGMILMANVLVLDEKVDVLPDDQFLQMSVATS